MNEGILDSIRSAKGRRLDALRGSAKWNFDSDMLEQGVGRPGVGVRSTQDDVVIGHSSLALATSKPKKKSRATEFSCLGIACFNLVYLVKA